MEEILKTIEKEVEELKIKKEELTNLENESDAAREEWKKAAQQKQLEREAAATEDILINLDE